MLSIFIYVYVISCICFGMKCDEFLYIFFWNFIEVVFMFKILFSIFIYFMVSLYKKIVVYVLYFMIILIIEFKFYYCECFLYIIN